MGVGVLLAMLRLALQPVRCRMEIRSCLLRRSSRVRLLKSRVGSKGAGLVLFGEILGREVRSWWGDEGHEGRRCGMD